MTENRNTLCANFRVVIEIMDYVGTIQEFFNCSDDPFPEGTGCAESN